MADVLKTSEAADYLRISTDKLKRLARAGLLPAAKIGRGWRFRKVDLDDWLSRGGTLQQEPAQTKLPV